MLAGTCLAVVASRLFQARTESRPSIGGIRAPEPVATITAREAVELVVADRDAACADEAPGAAEEVDLPFFEPGQLPRVVLVVDRLVAAALRTAAGSSRASSPTGTPGIRCASASTSAGRSSAFEGMQA